MGRWDAKVDLLYVFVSIGGLELKENQFEKEILFDKKKRGYLLQTESGHILAQSSYRQTPANLIYWRILLQCVILRVSTNVRVLVNPKNRDQTTQDDFLSVLILFMTLKDPALRCVNSISNKSFTLFSLFYCCKWVVSYWFACCC